MGICRRLVTGLAVSLPLPTLLGSASFSLPHRGLSALDGVAETPEWMHVVRHLQALTLTAAMPPNDYPIRGSAVEREAFARLSRALDEAFDRARAAPRPQGEQGLLRESRHEWPKAKAIASRARRRWPGRYGPPGPIKGSRP